MINDIQSLLMTPTLLMEKVAATEGKTIKGMVYRSWNPAVRVTTSSTAEARGAFVQLLGKWCSSQKEYGHPKHARKTHQQLLTQLFGTSRISTLVVNELTNRSVLRPIADIIVTDQGDEAVRLKEMSHLKRAKLAVIDCQTGDRLYFGRTPSFYFLISKQFLDDRISRPVKDIHRLLFDNNNVASVRKRPGMYLGSIGQAGALRLLSGLVEDVLTDAKGNAISLNLVSGNTFELSCESYSLRNNTVVFNHLMVANGVSKSFVYRDTQTTIRTENGQLIRAVKDHTMETGMTIFCELDPSIMGDVIFDYPMILNRMLQLAALNPYTIHLSDHSNQNEIYLPSGIEYFLQQNLYEQQQYQLHSFAFTGEGFSCTVAMSFSDSAVNQSYVNNRWTAEGGSHTKGLEEGAELALERILALYDHSLTTKDVLKYFNYVIHIQMKTPRWQGAQKRKLTNPEVQLPIQKQVEAELYYWLIEDIRPLKAIWHSLF